jgi:hypothetical protein
MDNDTNSCCRRGPGRETSGHAPSLLPGLGAAAAIAMLYFGFLSGRYNLDGTVFALWLEQAVQTGEMGKLWHPRHLIYLPLAFMVAKPLAAIGLGLSSITVLQLINVIFGFLTLVIFHLTCMRITRDRVVAVITTALLGFSFGFWYYSIEPEVIILYAFLALSSLAALFRFTSPGARSPWAARALVLGLLGGLTLSSHASGGLVLIPLGWGALIYLRRADGPPVQRARAGLAPALLFTAVAFAVSGAFYHHGYISNPLAAGQGFADWVAGKFNPATGAGYGKSYWAYSPSAILDWFQGLAWTFVASPRRCYADPGPAWLGVSRAVAAVGVLGAVFTYPLLMPGLLRENFRLHTLLALFIAPLAVFTIFWDPRHFEFKVALLPPLWLAAAAGAAAARRRWPSARGRGLVAAMLTVACLGLFCSNFFGSFLPGSYHENNRDLQRAFFIRDHTEPGAVVYIAGINPGYNVGKIYLPYFARRQARVVDWILARSSRPSPEPLILSLHNDRKLPVYVITELVEQGPVLEALCINRNCRPKDISDLFVGLGTQRTAAFDKDFGLYRVKYEAK